MTGKSCNNKQSGQVLLITIMLLVTAVTVALSVSFSSNTETQITKLEEESQKAFAAAEAGVEVALRNSRNNPAAPPVNINTLPNLEGFTGSASVLSDLHKTVFTSPSLAVNEQFTFYLADRDVWTNPVQDELWVYYEPSLSAPNCNNNALEFVLLKQNEIARYVADPNNALSGSPANRLITSYVSPMPGTSSLRCKIIVPSSYFTNPADDPPRLLIVRSLIASTKLGFELDSATNTLPIQGKYVVSQAQSVNTGVTKKIQLYQSNAQIPVDFFITRF